MATKRRARRHRARDRRLRLLALLEREAEARGRCEHYVQQEHAPGDHEMYTLDLRPTLAACRPLEGLRCERAMREAILSRYAAGLLWGYSPWCRTAHVTLNTSGTYSVSVSGFRPGWLPFQWPALAPSKISPLYYGAAL